MAASNKNLTDMSSLLYASRSKISMATSTKKTVSFVKGAFKGRPLNYRVMPNIFYVNCCLFRPTLRHPLEDKY